MKETVLLTKKFLASLGIIANVSAIEAGIQKYMALEQQL